MARPRNLRPWCLALWAVCLLAASSVHFGTPPEHADRATPPAAVALVSQSPGAAVLPARVADDVHASGHAAPLRVVVLAAVLALLAGLPAVLRRRLHAVDRESWPLRSRRHTIALRAPPLQFA